MRSLLRRAAAVLGGAAILLALMAAAAAASAAAKPAVTHPAGGHGAANDCPSCHACNSPSTQDPCLRACPRTSLGKAAPAAGPDVVNLDELMDLYVPVRFNHRAHARMSGLAKGCESCHHHTPEAGQLAACKSCHPASVPHEDLAQPGLKGAYHRLCFRCHLEWDKDTSCDNCHEKRAGGRLQGAATSAQTGSRYPALEMKELVVFKTNYTAGDEVPFHHKRHATLYETDCNICHRNESCAQCHTQGAESHPMGDPSKVHLRSTCFVCHRADGRGSLPDSRCQDCHGRDQKVLFDHASTGWGLAAYHSRLACRDCHGQWTARARLEPRCESCHTRGFDAATFDHRVTGVALNATHGTAACSDCHTQGIGRPPVCTNCHDDGRTYDKAKGFGS